MRILGIVGKKHHGKTTLANFLQKNITGPTKQIAFADALKQEVAHAIGQSVETVEINKTVLRLLLQAWGTDFRRRLCREDYWIQKLRTSIMPHYADGTLAIIIPDCRFENEGKWIQSIPGSILIRITRTNFNLNDKDTHASEVEQDHILCNYTIINDGDLMHLNQKSRELIKWINLQNTPKHKMAIVD